YAGFLAATGWDAVLDLLGPADSDREIVDVTESPSNNQFTTPTRLNVVSGRFTLDRVSIDPALDKDYFRFTLANVGAAGQAVNVLPPPDTRADLPGLLRLTLYNASQEQLAPAVHQTSSDQPLTISLDDRPAGDYVVLVESDNGVAIPEYLLDFNAPTASTL